SDELERHVHWTVPLECPATTGVEGVDVVSERPDNVRGERRRYVLEQRAPIVEAHTPGALDCQLLEIFSRRHPPGLPKDPVEQRIPPSAANQVPRERGEAHGREQTQIVAVGADEQADALLAPRLGLSRVAARKDEAGREPLD